MSQSFIICRFSQTRGPGEGDASVILRALARAFLEEIPRSDGIVEERNALLELVERLAREDTGLTQKIAGQLPYESRLSNRYLKSASDALLEQAGLDAEQGVSRASSVWVEVARLAGEPRANMAEPDDQASPTEQFQTLEPQSYQLPEISYHLSQSAGGSISFHSYEKIDMAGVAAGAGLTALQRIGEGSPLVPTVPAGAAGEPGAEDVSPTIAPSEPEAHEYRVWFGTNRKPMKPGSDHAFTNDRGTGLSYGYCDVYVPESHKIGSLGSSFLTRLVTRMDDRLKLQRTCPLPEEALWALVRSQLESVDANESHAVIFVHGYNVTFNEAALRAAQIGFDLGIDGAMAFFSWPSRGTVAGYAADEASIEASEPAITEFLIAFAEQAGASAVHVIAHSMGNRGVLRAVGRIAADAERRSGVRFDNFILAAPDVDANAFLNLAEAYRKLARRTTLYVSQRDKAVELSKWIHDYPRVGFAPPVSVIEGIDTISVTNVDLTMLGHGYVGEAREVLADMHSLIFSNEPPERRFSLTEVPNDGRRYWALAD